MRICLLASLLPLFIPMAFISHARAQNVEFMGSVISIADRDANGRLLDPEQVTYPGCQGATIVVMRQSPVNGVRADTQGNFQMGVPAGEPVLLLFDGGGHLKPVLEMLTADPVKPQRIHVTLLTFEQFINRFGREALIGDIERTIRMLRKVKNFNTKELEDRLRRLTDISVR